jgi:hypothetical protein
LDEAEAYQESSPDHGLDGTASVFSTKKTGNRKQDNRPAELKLERSQKLQFPLLSGFPSLIGEFREFEK